MWIFAIIGLLALLLGNTRFPMATAVYIVVMIGACIFNDWMPHLYFRPDELAER